MFAVLYGIHDKVEDYVSKQRYNRNISQAAIAEMK